MSDTDLRDEIAYLRDRLARLESRVASASPAAAPAAEPNATPSRRGLLKMAGLAAIGAAGAAVTTSVPASAATGGSMTLGQSNDANATTSLVTTGGAATPVSMLQVQGGGQAAPGATQQGLHGAIIGIGLSANDGVNGYAAGTTGYGVLGQSDSGYGVVGATDTGVDVAALGTGRLQQRPVVSAGPPAFTPTAGRFELARDAGGAVWASNASGWRALSSFNIFPNPRRVYGDFSFTPSGTTTGPIDATTQVPGSPFNGQPTGVPAGASAAWCVVMSYEAGVITLFPDGTSDPGIGTITTTGNGTLLTMNYLLIPLSAAGKFRMHSYINSDPSGRGGRIFIDVWGYLG